MLQSFARDVRPAERSLFGVLDLFADPRLYMHFAVTTAGLVAIYILLVITAFVHSWVTSTKDERKRSEFSLVLLALAIALLPQLVRGLASIGGSREAFRDPTATR